MLIVVSVIVKISFMNVCIIVVTEIVLAMLMFVLEDSWIIAQQILLFALNASKDMNFVLVQVE